MPKSEKMDSALWKPDSTGRKPKLPEQSAPEQIEINDIIIGERRRPLNDKKVVQFENSIRDQGFLQPIHLYRLHGMMKGKFKLVAGRHRLQALINLGYEHAMAIMIAREQAAAWEAAENLFRNDLSELQRSIEIVRYAEGRKRLSSVQANERKVGGRQPHDRGFKDLAKATGIDRKRIAEAFLHVQLPASVKRSVLSHPELDKRTVLNAICSMTDEAEQLAVVEGKLLSLSGIRPPSFSSANRRRVRARPPW